MDGVLSKASKSLRHQRNEVNSGGAASGEVGGQFALDPNFQGMAWGEGCLRHGLLLEWTDYSHVQGCGAAKAPMWEEDIRRAGQGARDQTREFLRGGQGSRLGSRINDVSHCVMSSNAVTIPSTPDLVISKLIGSAAALWAAVGRAVKRDPQPVLKATPKLSVVEVKAKRHGWDHIEPVSSMGQAG